VALYLHLMDNNIDFEAVFVDHGGDWPETYEYVDKFVSKYPLTILKPKRKTKFNDGSEIVDSIVKFCELKKMMPSRVARWCTSDFKRAVLNAYQETPCFVMIGFDWGERHRAKIYTNRGREFRYPLIEDEIDRNGCIEIIKKHGLKIPPKSGCYICPFQRVGQLRLLRRKHPELFCKLERLENNNNAERAARGLKPYYSFKKPVRDVAEKGIEQTELWPDDEFPPCECGL